MKIDRQLFRTGIPLIDNQHEAYLNLVDSLFEQCNEPEADKKKIDQAIREAHTYAVEHFDAEEALMRSVNYPGLEAHRTKHDEFRDELDNVTQADYETMTPEALLVHLSRWLVEWFCEQTQVYDKALAAYLKKQEGISPPED